MDIDKIKNVYDQLNNLCNRAETYSQPIPPTVVASIKDPLLLIAEDIKNEYPGISSRLKNNRELLFINQRDVFGNFFITFNAFRSGMILESLSFLLKAKTENLECIWDYIHPLIIKSSKNLYVDGHYTNAAEDALIEINSRLKNIYKTLKPKETNVPDGTDLMHKIFTGNPPLLLFRNDNSDTAKNIQEGFRFMFAGAMSALRNPKAHSNEEIISAEESLRRLMFASTLMYAVDEAVRNKEVSESFQCI